MPGRRAGSRWFITFVASQVTMQLKKSGAPPCRVNGLGGAAGRGKE
jgi:hypothetical protein